MWALQAVLQCAGMGSTASMLNSARHATWNAWGTQAVYCIMVPTGLCLQLFPVMLLISTRIALCCHPAVRADREEELI